MKSTEILERYLAFYKKRDHKQIPNVSLIPEGDSTLLFVNSGMFPLVPYLSGGAHPLGKRLLNVQRSLRFEDIDDIGDPRHTVAFHMMGNWSLGDYFKAQQLPWVYEFLTNQLELDPRRMFATVFAGDTNAPKDEESINLLKGIFKSFGIDAKEGERIFACDNKSNWWQRGDAVGELGGPDSEIYYYLPNDGNWQGKDPTKYEDEFLEIGNSVFMQYIRTESGWQELPQKNVDFGGGLERLAMVAQGKTDIFETDNFWPIVEEIQKITGLDYHKDEDTKKYMRILADHVRASYLLAMDGVTPSNKDQGYVLRRLLRKMFRTAKHLGVDHGLVWRLVGKVKEIGVFNMLYGNSMLAKERYIEEVFSSEEAKFARLLKTGEKEAKRIIESQLNGAADTGTNPSVEVVAKKAFDLYQSLGYPLEIFYEDLKDYQKNVSYLKLYEEFTKLFGEHQAQSRTGAEGKFKGGLADHSDIVVKYHTATHLLQQALKTVLGEHVCQLGSNITDERLRFDFPHAAKLTENEIKNVERIVNEIVDQKLPVAFVMLPKVEAINSGALYMKHETYPDTVKVYYIGNSLEAAFSKEFCGGPHVINTSGLGYLEIIKQEAIGEGKMRLYARFKL